ncbi:hypothetical protein MMC10_001612 [Thelotrema lepadinum]|nr:hypothetical protein [Thelotrema lepadinum]
MTVRQKRKTERAKTEVQDQQERDYLTSERRNQCPAESKGNQADVQSLPAVVSNEKSLSVLVAKHEPRSSPEADNYSDLASRDTLQTRDLMGICLKNRGGLGCYHHRMLCSYMLNICQHPDQACLCSHNPLELDACRAAYHPCTCTYNPYKNEPVDPDGTHELPAPSRKRPETEKKQQKKYPPRVKFPPGVSPFQGQASTENKNQQRSYLQSETGNSLSIRGVLQPVLCRSGLCLASAFAGIYIQIDLAASTVLKYAHTGFLRAFVGTNMTNVNAHSILTGDIHCRSSQGKLHLSHTGPLVFALGQVERMLYLSVISGQEDAQKIFRNAEGEMIDELAKGKFVNRAQRRYEPSQKRGPLAIPRNRVLALIYPNGYCSMTGGKGPRLRCFHRRRACSDLLSDCQYKWQPCMCQFNPYPPEESGKKQLSIVAPKKAQTNIHEKGISRRAVDKYDSTDQAYPNGFCRIRTGNTPGLMCHIKRRMCSYREDVCHHFRGPCICEFNPYGPVENLPTRKKLIKEALAHARPKTHIKSDGNKRRKIESQAQGRTHSPQPVGYCRWTRGRSLTLACYHHQRQCSFITGVCQHPQDPCMCSFNPYTASPILVQKQTPTKAEKSPINAHKSPLVQRPFSARAKQSPNNAASPPPVLRRPTTRIKQPPNNDAKESWLYRSKSTKATDVGGTAVSELVFPHGYCRRQSTREAELRCYIGQRMCSVEKESCRAAWEPCVCVYDPYKKIWW